MRNYLKEDGSLDIDKINNLNLENYMKVINRMNQKQYEEYSSKSTLYETKDAFQPNRVDNSFIERNGLVDADEFLNKIKYRYGLKR